MTCHRGGILFTFAQSEQRMHDEELEVTSLVCKPSNEDMTKNRHTSLVCKAGNEGMTKNMETPTLCAKLVMKACRRTDTSLVCKAGNEGMT